jgi:hypothetical protein
MIATKLTLSATPRVVADAKRLAESRHTSVSALFNRFVEGLKQAERAEPEKLGQITRRAAGLVHLPANVSDKDLVADALGGKYSV